jgi:hypothetical protein
MTWCESLRMMLGPCVLRQKEGERLWVSFLRKVIFKVFTSRTSLLSGIAMATTPFRILSPFEEATDLIV